MSTSEDQLAARLASPIKRPLHTWTIPEAARLFPTDPRTFTMAPYTLADEIDASRAAKVSGSLQYELVKKAVVRINDQPVADLDWLDKTSPTVRALLSQALDAMLVPPDEAIADFRASLKKSLEG